MNIAVFGIGLMGAPIAARLLQQGYPITVYNRGSKNLTELQSQGAIVAETSQAAIEANNFLLLTLSDAQAIRETLIQSKPNLKHKTIIQMGTIAPQESQEIAHSIQALGGDYIEAPVLGSIPEAKTGTLLIFVGASQELFDRTIPILKSLGETPRHMGEVGTAAATKLALNQLIGSLTSAFSISLALVQNSNVNLESFMEILRQSALYAPTFDKKLQRMVDQNYSNPNFPTKHLLKDMKLTQTTAQAQGIDTQLIEAVINITERSIQQGQGESDYSAIHGAIFKAITPKFP
jgi:3-hydroxyisobutyrate dehydrogenase